MTRTTKKDEERRALNAFLSVFDIEPENVSASERPDFVLDFDARTIGVEIVGTTLPSLATLHSTSTRLESELAAALEQRGVFVDLTVMPHANSAGIASLSALDQRAAKSQIVDLASALFVEARENARALVHERLAPSLGGVGGASIIEPRFRISSIRDVFVKPRDDRRARVAFGASASRLGGAGPRLSEIVASKDAKVDEYRKSARAESFWLVVHVDGSFSSEFIEHDVVDVEVASKFDGVAIVGGTSSPADRWGRWLKRPE